LAKGSKRTELLIATSVLAYPARPRRRGDRI